MNVRSKRSKRMKMRKASVNVRAFIILSLIFILSPFACTPAGSPTSSSDGLTATLIPEGQSSVTFTAEADSYARQSRPSINYGLDPSLRVDSGGDRDHEAFIRFSVTGVSGQIERALLRVYVTNGTDDGPAVFLSESSWNEPELTWRQRPGRGELWVDNLDRLRQQTWAEFDVTPLVAGNGTISFALVTDSSDAVIFSSREGGQPPQLVIFSRDPSSSIIPRSTGTATIRPVDSIRLEPNQPLAITIIERLAHPATSSISIISLLIMPMTLATGASTLEL